MNDFNPFSCYGSETRIAFHSLGAAAARDCALVMAAKAEERFNLSESEMGKQILASMRDSHFADAVGFDGMVK